MADAAAFLCGLCGGRAGWRGCVLRRDHDGDVADLLSAVRGAAALPGCAAAAGGDDARGCLGGAPAYCYAAAAGADVADRPHAPFSLDIAAAVSAVGQSARRCRYGRAGAAGRDWGGA